MQTTLDAEDTKTFVKPGFIIFNPETHRFETILGIMAIEYERANHGDFEMTFEVRKLWTQHIREQIKNWGPKDELPAELKNRINSR